MVPPPSILCRFVLILLAGWVPGLRADAPALLARAFEQWAAGRDDLAFTQQTRFLLEDGTVKLERIERYDPSLPDDRRWRLIETNGRAATAAERKKWEGRKNGKARKKIAKSPSEYVDLEHATVVDDNAKSTRFEVRLRPDMARLLGVEKLSALVTVDKESGGIVHVTATLRQPMRVLLGLARITDLDVDVHVGPVDENSSDKTGEVQTGSTARLTISELGTPVEYSWSDFQRVKSFSRPVILD